LTTLLALPAATGSQAKILPGESWETRMVSSAANEWQGTERSASSLFSLASFVELVGVNKETVSRSNSRRQGSRSQKSI